MKRRMAQGSYRKQAARCCRQENSLKTCSCAAPVWGNPNHGGFIEGKSFAAELRRQVLGPSDATSLTALCAASNAYPIQVGKRGHRFLFWGTGPRPGSVV